MSFLFFLFFVLFLFFSLQGFDFRDNSLRVLIVSKRGRTIFESNVVSKVKE